VEEEEEEGRRRKASCLWDYLRPGECLCLFSFFLVLLWPPQLLLALMCSCRYFLSCDMFPCSLSRSRSMILSV